MPRRFRFSLIDALDAAERERERCEAGVAAWQARRRIASAEVQRLTEELRVGTQQRLGLHDDFVRNAERPNGAAEFGAIAACRAVLQTRVRQLHAAQRAAELECAFLDECIRIWTGMTSRAEARVRALREMRSEELRRFLQRIERRHEESLAELAVTRATKDRNDADRSKSQ